MVSEEPSGKQEHAITREEMAQIIDEALDKQRGEIFGRISDVIGYDVGDKDEMKELRKDLFALRKIRLRGEEFQSAGRKAIFLAIWTGLIVAFSTGMWSLIADKVKEFGQ